MANTILFELILMMTFFTGGEAPMETVQLFTPDGAIEVVVEDSGYNGWGKTITMTIPEEGTMVVEAGFMDNLLYEFRMEFEGQDILEGETIVIDMAPYVIDIEYDDNGALVDQTVNLPDIDPVQLMERNGMAIANIENEVFMVVNRRQ